MPRDEHSMIQRDRNNLWSEMPPSSKGKSGKTNTRSSSEAGGNAVGKQKRSAKTSDAHKKSNKRRTAGKQAAKKTEKTPEYLSENETVAVAKPMDIQGKAIKNKSKRRREIKREEKATGKKRRARASAYALYYVLFGIAVVAIIYILSTTVLFNIESITVKGESVYSSAEVEKAAAVDYGENLVRLDASALEARLLEELPYIDKVKVRKVLPSTLEIEVCQAQAVANVQKNDVYYLVSANGRIMDASLASPDKDYVVVTGFDPEYAGAGDFISPADEGSRNNLCKLLKLAKKYSGLSDDAYTGNDQKDDLMFALISEYTEVGIADKIKGMDISNIYNISLNYDNRYTLQLGEYTEINLKLTVAKNLIDAGKFEGEKGILLLSGVLTSADAMKVTFRPVYDENDDDPDDTESDTEDAENSDNSEGAEDTQYPEETETPDNAEDTEDTQYPEETETPDNAEDAEDTQYPEETETPDNAEDTEDTQYPEETETPDNTEDTEDTQYPVETETPENTEVTEDTQYSEETEPPDSVEDTIYPDDSADGGLQDNEEEVYEGETEQTEEDNVLQE